MIVLMVAATPTPEGRTAEMTLNGTPDELASHLASLPRITAIEGHASKMFSADQATAALAVVTEDKFHYTS